MLITSQHCWGFYETCIFLFNFYLCQSMLFCNYLQHIIVPVHWKYDHIVLSFNSTIITGSFGYRLYKKSSLVQSSLTSSDNFIWPGITNIVLQCCSLLLRPCVRWNIPNFDSRTFPKLAKTKSSENSVYRRTLIRENNIEGRYL